VEGCGGYLGRRTMLLFATTHWFYLVRFARPITGILLGVVQKDRIHITDAIPLFHNYVLAPMLELSMLQVKAHAC